jgi:tyrosinase
MVAVRRNILADPGVARGFADGVLALKGEHIGPSTADFGIAGPAEQLSTYDLFVVWHNVAMMRMTPPGQGDRNAAHSGPVFLPWHRLMLILFELQLQRLLGDPDFGLPYWDWAADGDLPAAAQPSAALWTVAGIGGSGAPVSDGPFRSAVFRVRVEADRFGGLRGADRGLTRDLAADVPTLSTSAQVGEALTASGYDGPLWGRGTLGFRNRVEGWAPSPGPRLHNRVHVWVGGDMGPATSPNDPVFYLNHCNVDRLWEAWMSTHGRSYAPPASAPADLAGHRLADPMFNLLITQPVTPADMLEASAFYSYDLLP